MNSQVYISCSFALRKLLVEELKTIKSVLLAYEYQPWVFVEHYTFTAQQEKEMMQQAMQDIENSAFLLAETTDKGIGIGIEAGYAKALKKPVVYLRKQSAEHSTTLAGLSDYQIIYQDAVDLATQLEEVIQVLSQRQEKL
ncbi:nucleoside 2-deoxyribosyltransferase [Myroides odoratus]|uniref:nucleoside 2-deoxyribosyltransferase n=1 Tax=Myroides odoratus TaxID=256 RepID=UPI000765D0C9|nr:nucleoside 2-deoxyribosyltransferase [Myroides odoratus]